MEQPVELYLHITVLVNAKFILNPIFKRDKSTILRSEDSPHFLIDPLLINYVNQMRAMYEKLVILSVLTTYAPEVADSERIEIEKLGHGVWRITARYWFMESPDMT
jgi:K+ transporter